MKWTLGFAGFGVLVPIALLSIAAELYAYLYLHRIVDLLWPSHVWLLATTGMEDTVQDRFIVGLSIGANAGLYGLAGAILSLFRRDYLTTFAFRRAIGT